MRCNLIWHISHLLACAEAILLAAADAPVRKTKVVILGGGASGISAARTLALVHNITDFVIVEARGELGGRLMNVHFAGHQVELGGNWVHGLGKNPIWALAQKWGLKTQVSNFDDNIMYDQHGIVAGKAESQEFLNAYTEATKMAVERHQRSQVDLSARTGYSIVGWNPDTPVKRAIEYFNFDYELAESPEVSSLDYSIANHNWTFNGFSRENHFVLDDRGFKYIIEQEALTFLERNDDRLLLNSIVKDVAWSSNGVTVTTILGNKIMADYAISTFSIGVLQNEDVTWTPPFPAWKIEGVFGFHMATYSKIFLSFPSKFWDKNQFILYADPHRRGHYTVWQNLHAQGFFPESTDKYLLLVTVTGTEAHRIETMRTYDVKLEIMQVLRKMYGNDIPSPSQVLMPRWQSNPLFRGTYSNWPIGQLTQHHDNMRAPLGDGRLWFTGESMSREYFGYLHGAWIEGEKTAHAVAECLTTACPKTIHHEILRTCSPERSFVVQALELHAQGCD